MAKKVTTRKPLFGNSRSKALNITKKRSKINVQSTTINGEKILISTREARNFKKTLKDNK